VSLFGELALAEDVQIFEIAELAPELRQAIAHDADDFVLTRARGRDSSQVIGPASRDLLLEFKAPKRIVDAVIGYAAAREVDPQATLDGAFEMLLRFYRAGVLVPRSAPSPHGDASHLEPGMNLCGVMLVQRMQDLEDTEVFFARDGAGRPVAVKVLRDGTEGVRREADAMRRAGPRLPEVRGVHEWNGRGVLVSEWIFGDVATDAAGWLRGRRESRSEAGLLALACEVVGAFAELHGVGVLHGDVHPENVLIERGGRVRIVDLGLAVDVGKGPAPPRRGGIAFYIEPELAMACARGEVVPSSVAGEQYALAALVVLLWTGVHYLDFSLERGAMLDQIARAAPVPFARRGIPAWPELEAVLGRALAKAPADRFPSCDHFGAALRALLPEARRRDEVSAEKRAPVRDPGGRLAADFFERCGIGGRVLRDRPHNPPFASVNYGAAGIAYAMLRLAHARDDARLLATADVWAQKALVLSDRDEAFHTSAIEINENTVGNASLFHSPSGVHAVGALVALAWGEAESAARAVGAFLAASRVPCAFVDLTLGAAGLLVGCAELLEAFQGARGGDPGAIVARGEELRTAIERAVAGPDIATATSMSSLGLAHGWAGLLFALLRWSQARGESAEPYRARLDELGALHEPHGLGIRWPVENRTVPRASYVESWCNGSAGHALLWALAYERLGDATYGVYAERSAASAWSSEVELGTVCCGLAGVGYACAAAHRVSGDAVWLSRARLSARRACEDRSEMFYRDSLYKGAVGAVLLREELDAGRPAAPFLERVAVE
jgi:serine/threonine-protein kinase